MHFSQDVTDMYNYLLRNRVIFIGSRINDEVSRVFAAYIRP
jgi:ATP-dependent protease ClpP protease subunit